MWLAYSARKSPLNFPGGNSKKRIEEKKYFKTLKIARKYLRSLGLEYVSEQYAC
jgi:hypothetical protein